LKETSAVTDIEQPAGIILGSSLHFQLVYRLKFTLRLALFKLSYTDSGQLFSLQAVSYDVIRFSLRFTPSLSWLLREYDGFLHHKNNPF
jgi:hypothetical protein